MDRRAAAGFRLQPEVAARFPRITNDARTFMFTIPWLFLLVLRPTLDLAAVCLKR